MCPTIKDSLAEEDRFPFLLQLDTEVSCIGTSGFTLGFTSGLASGLASGFTSRFTSGFAAGFGVHLKVRLGGHLTSSVGLIMVSTISQYLVSILWTCCNLSNSRDSLV